MIYYRLVIKQGDRGLEFSDIVQQKTDDSNFQKMQWDKPLIEYFDGKHLHYLSLSREYLDCVTVGIVAHNKFV